MSFCRLVGSLLACSLGWLTGMLVSRLDGWSVGWLVFRSDTWLSVCHNFLKAGSYTSMLLSEHFLLYSYNEDYVTGEQTWAWSKGAWTRAWSKGADRSLESEAWDLLHHRALTYCLCPATSSWCCIAQSLQGTVIALSYFTWHCGFS